MDKNAVWIIAHAVSIGYFLRMEWREGDRLLIVFLFFITGYTEHSVTL